MRQNGVDQGPRVANTFDRHPRYPEAPDCGPVRIFRNLPHREVVWPPYTEEERAEIVRRGKEEPRRLTLAESRLARENRLAYQDNVLAMEDWYSRSSYLAPEDMGNSASEKQGRSVTAPRRIAGVENPRRTRTAATRAKVL